MATQIQARCRGSFKRLAVLSAGALILTACGGTSSTGGDGKAQTPDQLAAAKESVKKAATAPTKITETTPLSKAPPKGKLIVFIGGPTPPDGEASAGMAEAAELLGWKSKRLTFDASNISTFNTALLQALSLNADYVVDSGIAEDQISQATRKKFADAGAKIIAYNVTPLRQSDAYVSLPGGRNAFLGGGKVLADWFVADSKGKGTVLNVNITAYPILTAFAQSFDKQVETTCSGCSIERMSQTFADLINGTVAGNVVSKLRANPSIKYVVSDNSASVASMDSALKAAGLDDVKLIGYGMDPATARSIKSGNSTAWAAYNFRYNGWAAVDAAARLTIGDPYINDKSVAPIWLITSDNVGDLPADAVFRGPDDGLKQFAELWAPAP